MDRRKIRTDLILFTGSQFLYKLVGYAVLMMLTRYLAREEMGQFFLAASLCSLTGLLTELGIGGYLTRQIATEHREGTRLFSEVISFQLPMIGAGFLLLNLIVLQTKPELSSILLLTSVYTILEQIYLSFGAVFVGYQRISFNVTAGTVTKLVLVALVFLAVREEMTIRSILWCYIIANVCLLGIALFLSRQLIGPIRLRWDGAAIRRFLPISLSFFGVGILGFIHFSADTLMLGYMHTFVAVATYETAFKFLEASRFLIRPVYTIYLPVITRLVSGGDRDRIRDLFLRLVGLTAGIGVVLAIIVALTAKWIIPFVFGPRYVESVPVLIVLYYCVPVLFTSLVGILFANATGHEKTSLRASALAVAFNIALNAFVIPRWGPVGAAWTTLVSHTFLSINLFWFNFRQLRAGMAKKPTPTC